MRPMVYVSLGSALLATAAVVASCTSPSDDESSAQPAATAAAPAAAAPATTPGVPPGTGRVLETMNSGGYTYVRVDLGGQETWAAGPQIAVKVGDTVTIPTGMAMENYRSSTLNRTFPVVWFVPAIQAAGATVATAADLAAAHQGVGTAAPAPAAAAPVARLEGGQSVEEIVTQRAALSGKDVAVRARVVKFNAGIMGTNWMHVQDGTGSAGSNDLTVTTDATAAVGDVVVVRGKLVTDKDFGSGYKYAVIVEKAAVEKQ